MYLEDPKTRLLAILDLICQRFPPYVFDEDHRRFGVVAVEGDVDNDNDEDDDHSLNVDIAYGPQLVQVTDSRNRPCSVSLVGFWLLQEMEENFGGGLETVVKIEGIMIDHLEEPWLTFLSLRHQDVMDRFAKIKKEVQALPSHFRQIYLHLQV